MSTSTKQDNYFRDSLIPNSLLEDAIYWIRSNMSPTDVFPEKELLSWAADFEPSDVFKESTLQDWAENNGYTRE